MVVTVQIWYCNLFKLMCRIMGAVLAYGEQQVLKALAVRYEERVLLAGCIFG